MDKASDPLVSLHVLFCRIHSPANDDDEDFYVSFLHLTDFRIMSGNQVALYWAPTEEKCEQTSG